MDAWPAQYIWYLGILALGWLEQCMSYPGIRIQLSAGGWGWRGLAGGCCCESVA